MAHLIPQLRHLEPGTSNVILVGDLTDLKEYVQDNCKPSILLDYSEHFVFVLFFCFFTCITYNLYIRFSKVRRHPGDVWTN